MVIHHVDCEKQDDVDNPSVNRDDVFGYEQRRPRPVELGDIARDGYEKELNESQKSPCRKISNSTLQMSFCLHTASRSNSVDEK